MEQAKHFVDECDALAAALDHLDAPNWDTPTQFKQWTYNDVLVHLHFWNGMAHQSLLDPEAFAARLAAMSARFQTDGMRATENAEMPLRGPDLKSAWQALYREMGEHWATVDPKQRVQWAGPDMSTRSSITARLMETWAHGQAVFDGLGLVREDSDRIRNVVILGVNTFGWTYKVNDMSMPAAMRRLFSAMARASSSVWASRARAAARA